MKTFFGILLAGMLIVPSLGFTGDGIINDPAVTIEFFVDEDGNVHDWGWANGQMWSARSSKNDVEMIGCSYKARELGDGSVYKWGFCQARDVNDVHVMCWSDNPELLDAMQATTPFAWAQFRFTEIDPNFFGGERHCTQFGYSTQSFHLPEFTTKGNQVSDD